MTKSPQSAWTQPEWHNDVALWVRDELTRENIQIVGEIEQPHIRPWSTVLRIPTTIGDVYFKASAPVLAFEAALTGALFHWHPQNSLPLIAVDETRGWLLMHDSLPRLREVVQPEGLEHWHKLLPRYAELQTALAEREADILSFGTPDRQLNTFPTHYAALIADKESMCIGHPEGLTETQYQILREYAPQVQTLCKELASYNIPASLHHGDLHDGNIFYQNENYIFFDWGDSSLSHPFFSLRTAYVSIENTLDIPEGDPIFDTVRDSYLEAWRNYGTMSQLREAFSLAEKLWSISSALIWYQSITSLPPSQRGDSIYAVPSLLQEFLNANQKL